MVNKLKLSGIVLGLAIIAAGLFYVYTAPFNYARLPGVRIGGELTSPPANWNTIDAGGVVYLKMAGFYQALK